MKFNGSIAVVCFFLCPHAACAARHQEIALGLVYIYSIIDPAIYLFFLKLKTILTFRLTEEGLPSNL